MKHVAVLLLSLAGLAWTAMPATAQVRNYSFMKFRWISHLTASKLAPSKAAPGFDKLKSLVGKWNGKDAKGAQLTVTYELISNGSSLLETLMPAKEPSMVSIYHLDGDNLMMTHYCSMANQPRMRATVAPGEVTKLDFAFLDATNLASATDPHMHSVSIAFRDNDHMTQTWSMRHEGKSMPVIFEFERTK